MLTMQRMSLCVLQALLAHQTFVWPLSLSKTGDTIVACCAPAGAITAPAFGTMEKNEQSLTIVTVVSVVTLVAPVAPSIA